jgi:triosephosphate isomerase
MLPKLFFNWKMNPSTEREARALFTFATKTAGMRSVAIHPPVAYLHVYKKYKNIFLGAQDVSLFPDAHTGGRAHTGEVSVDILKGLGVKYVIVGHSERRALGETDVIAGKKAAVALKAGLTPILCVGEQKKVSSKDALKVVIGQIKKAGAYVDLKKVIIAYEPVWAISKGGKSKKVHPADAASLIDALRAMLAKRHAQPRAILYGGSVDCENIDSFVYYSRSIDGYLVGSASLRKKDVQQLIQKTYS